MKATSKYYWDYDHQAMILSVIRFSLNPENIGITSSVPAFAGYIYSLKDKINQVRQLRASIGGNKTGVAAQRNGLWDELAHLASAIMNSVYSYALDTNNLTLAGQMKTSYTAMKRMKYISMLAFSQGSIDIVTPLISNLGDYNIGAANMDRWQNLTNEFKNGASPVNAIAFRKAVNQQIQQLLRECMLLLHRNCDTIALQFKSSNLLYYNTYRASRKLRPHHLHTQLKAKVKDNEGNAIANADIYIIGTDKSGIRDAAGYSLITSIAPGKHEVRVSTKEGTESFGEVRFKMGKSITMHLNLKILPQKEEQKSLISVT